MTEKQWLVNEQQGWIGLRYWYGSPLGRFYAEAETALLADILPFLFGYHIVTLGVPSHYDLVTASPIPHRCRVDSVQAPADLPVDMLADPIQLPIASDSVDVVVLPHLLEFVAEPHAVLSEVDRILIPEGHALVLGFNPFSAWGLRRLLTARRARSPWDARPLSVARTRDWLTLLGFETLAVRYCFYRPPVKRLSLLNRLAFLERLGSRWWPCGGGGYLLLAKKRVSTLTPVKPRWQTRQPLIAEGMAKPSLRKSRLDR